jgi:hypothetical protein
MREMKTQIKHKIDVDIIHKLVWFELMVEQELIQSSQTSFIIFDNKNETKVLTRYKYMKIRAKFNIFFIFILFKQKQKRLSKISKYINTGLLNTH